MRPIVGPLTALAVLIFGLLLPQVSLPTASADAAHKLFLPVVLQPDASPEPLEPFLSNGSFEDGWVDLPPAPGNLINQQPNSWTLDWVEPGHAMFGSGDIAHGVPECVHKLTYQLPPHEQFGGSDPLILDGDATYKVFHFAAAFGVTLTQVITDAPPASTWTLTTPIRVHHQGAYDLSDVEAGVWVNGVGGWISGLVLGDRTWNFVTSTFTVPDDGHMEIVVRLKSRWDRGKDFFIDNIHLEQVIAP